LNGVSSRTIAAAIVVHREVGPGLIESAYARCLDHQLRADRLHTSTQVAIPLVYRDVALAPEFRGRDDEGGDTARSESFPGSLRKRRSRSFQRKDR
jgi:hypothetical protein